MMVNEYELVRVFILLLLDGGSMKTNKATYRMIMIYKQRGVPTIY